MGLFRPARTVRSPSGDYWELYVSKTALPSWRPDRSDPPGLTGSDFDLVTIPLAALAFVWWSVLFPLARAAALLPFAVVRGKRSRAVRIEAVTTYPCRQVLLWTTTDDQVDGVLDSIVAGLAEGNVVQPIGAVYSGAET
jgi:hypothetical protein